MTDIPSRLGSVRDTADHLPQSECGTELRDFLTATQEIRWHEPDHVDQAKSLTAQLAAAVTARQTALDIELKTEDPEGGSMRPFLFNDFRTLQRLEVQLKDLSEAWQMTEHSIPTQYVYDLIKSLSAEIEELDPDRPKYLEPMRKQGDTVRTALKQSDLGSRRVEVKEFMQQAREFYTSVKKVYDPRIGWTQAQPVRQTGIDAGLRILEGVLDHFIQDDDTQ